MRILVVEDELIIQLALQAAIEDAGLSCCVAVDGQAALDALDEEAFAAVATDVRLGRGMTGWEVAARARALDPGVPVVFMSGHAEMEWSARAPSGATLLTKPFQPEELVGVLLQAMAAAGRSASALPIGGRTGYG